MRKQQPAQLELPTPSSWLFVVNVTKQWRTNLHSCSLYSHYILLFPSYFRDGHFWPADKVPHNSPLLDYTVAPGFNDHTCKIPLVQCVTLVRAISWILWNLFHFISWKKDSKWCCYTTTPKSICTKDESKHVIMFAFIFGVNWPVQWV